MSDRSWTIREALDWTRGYLADKGDEKARLSAEWLLSAATGFSRIELYTNFDRPLDQGERAILREGVKRRATGEPLQYVTGEVAFRHIVVKIAPGVLIPRPETEVVVGEGIKALIEEGSGCDRFNVLDLCTGSGIIALSIASELPAAQVWATDVSSDAVACAQANVERLELEDRVSILEGDLADPVKDMRGRFDLVISNPPYIPSSDMDTLPREVAAFEPRLALDGGSDGLSVFERIKYEARTLLRPGGTLVCELDEKRVCAAANNCVEWYTDVRIVKDLAGRDRVLVARRT